MTDEKTIKNMLQLFEDEYINKKGHEVDIFRQLEGSWYFSEDCISSIISLYRFLFSPSCNNAYPFLIFICGEKVQELRNGVEGISNEKFDNIKKLQLRYLISNLVAAEQKFS